MKPYTFFLTHSLEKVFLDTIPTQMNDGEIISVLQGELPAIQLVYYKELGSICDVPYKISVLGAPVSARLRSVELVPSDFPSYERKDDDYITTKPGLFPDLLLPMKENFIRPMANQYRSVWIDFPNLEDVVSGSYNITVEVAAVEQVNVPDGSSYINPNAAEQIYCFSFILEVLPVKLPTQKLLHTEWFHVDCLANYYKTPIFGEEHWQIIENFIALGATELGMNVLLTPIFTPPLDTAVGNNRPMVQLVDISFQNDQYSFGFSKLERWCKLCKTYGITHLEMAHLFTQWGARATPQIWANVNGETQQVFGWHVASISPKYTVFLEAFIPALQKALLAFGYDNKHVLFHISDEPGKEHIENYKAAKAQVIDLLDDYCVIDALSDYQFYEEGLVDNPIPGNNYMTPFLEHKVPNLWVYYCCAQCQDVPNRFYALPSIRNRIMGVLMYLHNIAGFLHWGYNFYNSQFSLNPIDPYFNTSSNRAFPSGDPYLVYPGDDGKPLASIRSQVQRNALDDLGALQLLDSLAGREMVEKLIYEGVDTSITFHSYPKTTEYLFELRNKVNKEIVAHS